MMFLIGLSIVIAALIILIYILRWLKIVVTVPGITLAIVGSTQYDHGANVTVEGVVSTDEGIPAAGETISIGLTDSAGTEFPVGSALSDKDGKYTATFAVPSAVAPSSVTVAAVDVKLGVMAQATFTSHI